MEYPDNKNVSLRSIFLVFLKIGALAFGGAYSMLSFYEREIVEKRKWFSREDFAESVVIGQMSPGAIIVNTGIFMGYRLKKLKGALLTVAGQVLPSFVLILIISYLYITYKDITLMRSVLKGIAAAVTGLIASVVYRMSGEFLKDYKNVSLALITFLCLAIFRINPIVLIVASGMAGIMLYRREKN